MFWEETGPTIYIISMTSIELFAEDYKDVISLLHNGMIRGINWRKHRDISVYAQNACDTWIAVLSDLLAIHNYVPTCSYLPRVTVPRS